MNNINYKHKVILSTFSVSFKETTINIRYLFLLLRIEMIKNIEIKKKGHQYKITYPGVSNLIYSARYGSSTRGVITSNKKTFLKNSLCLHTTSNNKNIHVKMFKSNIEISAAQNLDEVIEITEYLRNRIFKIQRTLEFIKSHPKNVILTLNWVKVNTKGIKILIIKGTNYLPIDKEPIYERDGKKYIINKGKAIEILKKNIITPKLSKTIIYVNVPRKNLDEVTKASYNNIKYEELYTFDDKMWFIEGELKELETVYTLKCPDEYKNETYPAGVNIEIAELLLNKIFWFYRYSNYCRVISALCNLDTVCNSKLEYDTPKTSMIFINFYINFKIDIEKIYMLPREKFKEFYLIQDDDNTKFVKLQIPYVITEELEQLIKTNPKKEKVHTIQIYSQGRITICGPHLKLNEIVKMKLINLLNEIHDDISIPFVK